MQRQPMLFCLTASGIIMNFVSIYFLSKGILSGFTLLAIFGTVMITLSASFAAKSDGKAEKFENLPDFVFRFIGLLEKTVFVFEHTRSDGTKVFYVSSDIPKKLNPGDIIRKAENSFTHL